MIKVNLLNPEKKEVYGKGAGPAPVTEEVRESKIKIGSVIGAVTVTLGVIGFLYFSQVGRLDSQTRFLAERKARKTELENVLKTLGDLEKAKNNLDRKVKIIGDLKRQQKQTVFMMDELSRVLPDWVWLTKLSFSGTMLDISGRARTNHLVANFIDNLQATNHFSNITLNATQRAVVSGIEIFNFSLNCRYIKSEDNKEI